MLAELMSLNDDVSLVGMSVHSWMLGGVVIGVSLSYALHVDQIRRGSVHTTVTNCWRHDFSAKYLRQVTISLIILGCTHDRSHGFYGHFSRLARCRYLEILGNSKGIIPLGNIGRRS
jgi:hypothetical protein